MAIFLSNLGCNHRQCREIEQFQRDPKNLCQWLCEWHMLFNVDKCKVVHFDQNNDNGKCVYNGGTNHRLRGSTALL